LLIYAQNVAVVILLLLDKFTIIINQFEEKKLIYFCYCNNYIIVRTYL